MSIGQSGSGEVEVEVEVEIELQELVGQLVVSQSVSWAVDNWDRSQTREN